MRIPLTPEQSEALTTADHLITGGGFESLALDEAQQLAAKLQALWQAVCHAPGSSASNRVRRLAQELQQVTHHLQTATLPEQLAHQSVMWRELTFDNLAYAFLRDMEAIPRDWMIVPVWLVKPLDERGLVQGCHRLRVDNALWLEEGDDRNREFARLALSQYARTHLRPGSLLSAPRQQRFSVQPEDFPDSPLLEVTATFSLVIQTTLT